MKNIHILPTTQPSNLLLCIKSYTEHKDTPAENSDNKGNFTLGLGVYANKMFYQPHHIYITSAEEIKVGDWYYLPRTNSVHKCIEDPTELNLEIRLGVAKIIITTDQSLIVDGVQGIDDTFLEWFVNNPSCEKVEVLRCPIEGLYTIIPKEEQKQHIIDIIKSDEELGLYEEPKQETLEEEVLSKIKMVLSMGNEAQAIRFIEQYGYWQQERMFSEEEVFNLLMEFSSRDINSSSRTPHSVANWFEQFKKK